MPGRRFGRACGRRVRSTELGRNAPRFPPAGGGSRRHVDRADRLDALDYRSTKPRILTTLFVLAGIGTYRISTGEVAEALVVAVVIVMIDEGCDRFLECARQVIVFQ